MAVAVGLWIALAGALALVVGLSARHRVRELRRSGVKVWGTAVHHQDPEGSQQFSLQYTLEDGRVLERPLNSSRASSLAPGEKILVWYNPDEPAEILIYGRDTRASDISFITVGLILLLAGATIAILGP